MRDFVGAMFADSLTNWTIYLVLLLPAFDWIVGVLRAIADRTFDIACVDVFLRKTVAGRVVPILLLVLLGRAITVGAPGDLAIPGVDLSLVTAAGVAAAVPFLLATLASIYRSLDLNMPDAAPRP